MNKSVFIVCLITLMGCKDIFESDISHKKVVLLTPPDNYITYNPKQSFSWEIMEEAVQYQIQLLSSGANGDYLFVDSLISVNNFIINLQPGCYIWRVRAVNSVYKTNYASYNLVVDTSLDLSQTILHLNVPKFGDTINGLGLCFKWSENSNINMYHLVVNSDGDKCIDTMTNTNYLSYSGFTQGSYDWHVIGHNDLSSTLKSESSFFVDNVIPSRRTHSLPLNNSVVNDSSVLFRWSAPQTYGSSEYDSLFIYRDSLNANTIYSVRTSIREHQLVLNSGLYFWRIKAVDRAGNQSEYSETWRFSIAIQK